MQCSTVLPSHCPKPVTELAEINYTHFSFSPKLIHKYYRSSAIERYLEELNLADAAAPPLEYCDRQICSGEISTSCILIEGTGQGNFPASPPVNLRSSIFQTQTSNNCHTMPVLRAAVFKALLTSLGLIDNCIPRRPSAPCSPPTTAHLRNIPGENSSERGLKSCKKEFYGNKE